MSDKVLIVDDEAAIRKFLSISLVGHGFQILEADSGAQALEVMQGGKPDAVLLDMGLPDVSGIEVLRSLRKWSWIPILFISVNDEEQIKIAALDAGADDYLTKPFSTDLLLARLRAALRRRNAAPEEAGLVCGALTLRPEEHHFSIHGQRVSLTPTEFSIMRLFMRNPNRVLCHDRILTEVWGQAYVGETHMLRVNIFNLRKKLEADPATPRYLFNELGIGYRLSDRS